MGDIKTNFRLTKQTFCLQNATGSSIIAVDVPSPTHIFQNECLTHRHSLLMYWVGAITKRSVLWEYCTRYLTAEVVSALLRTQHYPIAVNFVAVISTVYVPVSAERKNLLITL